MTDPTVVRPAAGAVAGTSRTVGAILPAGHVVGELTVEAERHEGGFATVYRARRRGDDRPVALKVLHAEHLAVPTVLARFHREAEVIARLEHPHIVRVLGWGELPTRQPWIAMEWLEGMSLDRLLAERGRLTPAEALRLLEQVGGALAAAHAQGVIHRDVKAQNVIVRDGPAGLEAKVVDFGIARLAGAEERFTFTGAVMGTPISMAPEQIRGEPADERTDVYGAGVLLYLVLTGRLPFAAADRVELEEQHLAAPVPRPSDAAALPPALDDVVARAMAKRREDRHAGMAELLTELRRAVSPRRDGDAPAAFALVLEILLGDEADDAAWDAADALIVAAREAAVAAGLVVEHADATTLLALARLPAAPEAAEARRRELLAGGAALAEELRAGTAASPALGWRVRARAGERDELVRLATWPAPPAGLLAGR